MTVNFFYMLDDLHGDVVFFIAEKLYESRIEKKISLQEASTASGIELGVIDALECMFTDINFHTVARLLDLYQTKLDLHPNNFPKLPKSYHRKYFLE